MGVVVKLGKKVFEAGDEDRAYEFQSDKRTLASFGRTLVCTDLMEVLEDWIRGCRQGYELYDVGTQGHEIAKIQGRVEALVNFKEFLNSLSTLDHEFEDEEEHMEDII